MDRKTLRGRLVTDYEVLAGASLTIGGDSIEELDRGGASPEEAEVHDYEDSFVLPGFVDLQVNGCFGIDVATDPGRLPELSKKLLSTGTTSYLPALISSPKTLYQDALTELAEQPGDPPRAEALGAHLEGPFINPEKRGAHSPEHILQPDLGLIEELSDLGPVRMITLAPELEGAEKLISAVTDRGLVVSAGHSNASFEAAYGSFDRRVASVTHLFNAMGALHHREPGIPGAAFAHPRVVCGLIPDGLHVHPEVVGLAFRTLGPDRTYLVTDATAATGMGPGEYPLGTGTVYQDANVARLAGGALAGGAPAGSLITMNEALQNVLAFTGCTLPEAARMVSTTPARLIGEGRTRGRLIPGYKADVTVLWPDLSVRAVWKNGRQVY